MIAPFSLQNAPSLMEVIFPVQRLSAEVFKERQAVRGQAENERLISALREVTEK